MKIKKIISFIIIIAIIVICSYIYFNTGLKGFEKKVSNLILPTGIEKIAMKSGIGDSGGNGDYSTYRVVYIVRTKMSIDELNDKFAKRKLTSSSHILNSGMPICYITHCESEVFKSERDFRLTFDKLGEIEDYSDYYFLEFID